MLQTDIMKVFHDFLKTNSNDCSQPLGKWTQMNLSSLLCVIIPLKNNIFGYYDFLYSLKSLQTAVIVFTKPQQHFR